VRSSLQSSHDNKKKRFELVTLGRPFSSNINPEDEKWVGMMKNIIQ